MRLLFHLNLDGLPRQSSRDLQQTVHADKRGQSIKRVAMSIDTETARKVAKLARIRVADADLPKLADELSGILGFME